MHTLNIAFVFRNANEVAANNVVTVVCHSEKNIDRKLVVQTTRRLFNQRMAERRGTLEDVFSDVLFGIEEECGVNAVMVVANVANTIVWDRG